MTNHEKPCEHGKFRDNCEHCEWGPELGPGTPGQAPTLGEPCPVCGAPIAGYVLTTTGEASGKQNFRHASGDECERTFDVIPDELRPTRKEPRP